MNADNRYFGVNVLWGAADNVRVPQIESCAEAHQIPFYVPAAAEIPIWTRTLGECVFLLDFDFGEYEGPIGCLNDVAIDWRPRPDERTVRHYYLKKHPKWSKAKLKRAVEGKMAAFARGPKVTHDVGTDQQVRQYVAFLNDATRSGPLVFLLTEGERTLTSKAAEASRKTPLRVDPALLTHEQLVRWPSWTPIIIG